MKEIISHWKRNPAGDRPELVFPPHTDGTFITLPQVVGFLNEFGTPIELSKQRAERLGLIAVGEIGLSSMPVADWIELQKRKEQHGTV